MTGARPSAAQRRSTTRRETRERWAEEISARAEAYWTAERIHGQLGDKDLMLPPNEAAPLLRALGLIKADASMSPSGVRKYMQINHMVKLLESVFVALARRAPVVRVLDAGCGSSHLTLLLAWCFEHRWRRSARILGVDRNAQIIERCRERAEMALLDDLLRYEASTIDELDLPAVWADAFDEKSPEPLVHALVALHACDTATDDALALAIDVGAELIAAAPCCQAELARRWAELDNADASGPFEPIWGAPHLRREVAATMTDALRTLLLRGCGYAVTPMEFVPSTHTPKNTLLRAVRVGGSAPEHFERYVVLREALGGADIALARSISADHRRALEEAERRCASPQGPYFSVATKVPDQGSGGGVSA